MKIYNNVSIILLKIEANRFQLEQFGS